MAAKQNFEEVLFRHQIPSKSPVAWSCEQPTKPCVHGQKLQGWSNPQCDGDSKAYTAVCQAQPYGLAVFIPKDECVSHVTKRMGTGLRKLINEYKGKVFLSLLCCGIQALYE